MFVVDLCILTWRENLRGQVLWIACGTGVLILLALGLLSGAALSHQDRLLDVSTYFLVDAVSFLTAIFMGAHLFPRDFSNRGLAELVVPQGHPRATLYLGRLLGQATLLIALSLGLFVIRSAAFLVAENDLPIGTVAFSRTAGLMFLFSSTKLALALCVSALFGIFTRPVISLLASLALFLFGHFSSGVSGLRGFAEDSEELVSPMLSILFRLFRIWNPNRLVLESWHGGWEVPTTGEVGMRMAWGFAATAAFATLGALAVRFREVDSSRAG